jgi:hypothetical protein
MTLAELLIARKAEKNNLVFLEQRLKANAKVQEGEVPQELPDVILNKIYDSIIKIEKQTVTINSTNAATVWNGSEGTTLAQAIAKRDSLSKLRRILAAALDAATVKADRFGRMEIKYIPVLNVSAILSAIDETTEEYSKLEAKIQKKNWETEV